MRVKLGILVMIGASSLFFAGLCAPRLLYGDHDAGLTPAGAAMLKVQASQHGLQFPAVWRQITEGAGDVVYFPERSVLSGVVVSRAPFGIAYERTEIFRPDVVRDEDQVGTLLVAWGLFLVPELVPLGLAVFCLRDVLRKWRARIQGVVFRWERRNS